MAEKKIIVEREDLSSLSSHIREKSGSEAASLTWPTGFINEVDNISTGVDISGVTASAADILYDKKTFDINGDLVTGTIQQQTATNRNITAANQTETVNAGYYPSSFTVSIPSSAVTGLNANNMLDTATILGMTGNIPTVSPSKEELTTAADYVTIPLGYHPTVKTITIASSAITDLNSNNILSGKTILGVEGSIPTQSISDSVISTVSQSIPVPSGYYAFDTAIAIKSEDQENLVPSNIRSGITILGITGTADAGTIIEDTRYKSIIEKTITSIDDSAITTIGSYAFAFCPSLIAVNFPNCIFIDNQAFDYCRSLTSVNFPECTTIDQYAFYECNSLTSVNFPECTTIGQYAFFNCNSLSSINFPECTTIGNDTFYECNSLTSINFPECTTIGQYAFASCSALITANFPKCTTIDQYAFSRCSNLTTLNASACLSIQGNIFGASIPSSPSAAGIYWGSPITQANFPECTYIGQQAFLGCSSLTSADFPKCTYIGSSAFQYCRSLISINFPECITVGTNAFAGFYSTTTVADAFKGAPFNIANFPKCITISSGGFLSCSQLASISFPECTSIGNSAFWRCENLTSVDFPKCTSIGTEAFRNCVKLASINFPECTTINAGAFMGCYSLNTINFPECTYIGNDAFSYCSQLTSVNFPKCRTIGTSIFYSCKSLTTVNFSILSTGLTSGLFNYANHLTTAYFPQMLSLTSTSGFYGKSSLQNVTILGRSTSTIYGSTFKGCSRLMNLTILRSEGVAPLVATNAFTSTPISTYTTYTSGVNGSIYVPASLVDAYKSATNWATYAARITSIPEPTP